MEILSGSISRVLQQLNNSKFGVISAYLDINTDDVNRGLHSKLKQDIRKLNLGFVELASSWSENGIVSKEESLFIPNATKDVIIELGSKYDQFSILFGDNGVVEHICTVSNKCGSKGKVLESFTKTKLSEKDFVGAFSQLKKGGRAQVGRKFQLVSFTENDRPHGLPISSSTFETYKFNIKEA